MLNGHDVAKWFIFNNPELASGYIDENTKINKLLYFSNLMYNCIKNEDLIREKFVAFPNGPVVYSVYRDYRYNGLNRLPMSQDIVEVTEDEERILNIINFIYGNSTTKELVDESHEHSLWQSVKHRIPNNPQISFEHIEEELVEYNKALYETYSSLDFANLKKEKINSNIYYYFEDSFNMTEEIVEKLAGLEKVAEPMFLEMIDGELVVS